MGLTVLPARLDRELDAIVTILMNGAAPEADPQTAEHADWATGFTDRTTDRSSTEVTRIVREEIGREFTKALEHCAVFPPQHPRTTCFLRLPAALECLLSE